MRFFGVIGFAEANIEVAQDVFRDGIVERPYTGDVLRNNRGWSKTEYQNDSFTVNNQISIVADLYARQNWSSIRYVKWNDAILSVTNIRIDYPRIVLEIGGLYNGKNPVRVE